MRLANTDTRYRTVELAPLCQRIAGVTQYPELTGQLRESQKANSTDLVGG